MSERILSLPLFPGLTRTRTTRSPPYASRRESPRRSAERGVGRTIRRRACPSSCPSTTRRGTSRRSCARLPARHGRRRPRRTRSSSSTTAAATARSRSSRTGRGRAPDRIRVLELARNFGQHQAILAAFRDVTGDVVVTLDADLQNPPEEIPKLLAKIDEGYDVVGGIRQDRAGLGLPPARASALVNRVTVGDHRGSASRTSAACCAPTRATSSTRSTSCDEASTFIPALGAELRAAPDRDRGRARAARRTATSAYSLYRLIRLNFDLMTGFSLVPLQAFGLLGTLVAVGGVALRRLPASCAA